MAAHPVARMASASAVCWAALSLASGSGSRAAIFFGLLGPLAVTLGTWIVLERTHQRAPDRVSAALITLFAVKLALFGAYVSAVMVLLPAARMAFAVSFTCHYILLHVMEAWYLRRLFSEQSVPLPVS